MASWDSTSPLETWDSLVTWDALPKPGNTIKPMIELRTSLSGLKPDDQHTKMNTVRNGLAAHPALFPNLPVPLATFAAKVDAIEDNLDAILAKEGELKQLRIDRGTLLAEGRLMYASNAAHVAGASGNDAGNALLIGYEQAGVATPSPALGKVQNLSVSTGDNPGELDSQHDPVQGASGYESETSPDGNTGWAHASTTGISKETFTGLPSLTYRWVRTRAVKGSEHGPWSDPAKGLVP